MAPPRLLLITCWTKSMQTVSKVSVMPIPEVAGHPAYPVAAYRDLLLDSATTSPNQPLLTVTKGGKQAAVNMDILTRALKVMMDALGVDTTLYSLHSVRRGGGGGCHGSLQGGNQPT